MISISYTVVICRFVVLAGYNLFWLSSLYSIIELFFADMLAVLIAKAKEDGQVGG